MKIAVGISGGVDSAVTALLLRERGHEVVGVTMTLGREDEARGLAEAEAAAERLGIPFHTVDFADEWRRSVVDYIGGEYLFGRTPNPCVRCNESVKFSRLPEYCFDTLDCDGFATGHYARVEQGVLYRAKDRAKDQSYFLYRVKPDILRRTILPLGEFSKAEVRAIAAERGLPVASKSDSQDFCGGDVKSVFAAEPKPGDIVLRNGRVLGRHQGFWNYTIGKRKGLGIGGGTPYYVVELRPATNEVVVAPREECAVYTLELADTVGTIDLSLPVKVRSAGEPKLLRDGILGVAPGQSAVFYDGDRLVGGGIIR